MVVNSRYNSNNPRHGQIDPLFRLMSITLILTGYNIYFQQSNNFNIWYNCAYVDCQTTNEYDLRLVSCWRLWWTILTRLTVCYFVDWLSSTWRFWWLNFWLLLFLELFLTETVLWLLLWNQSRDVMTVVVVEDQRISEVRSCVITEGSSGWACLLYEESGFVAHTFR